MPSNVIAASTAMEPEPSAPYSVIGVNTYSFRNLQRIHGRPLTPNETGQPAGRVDAGQRRAACRPIRLSEGLGGAARKGLLYEEERNATGQPKSPEDRPQVRAVREVGADVPDSRGKKCKCQSVDQ